MEQESWFPDRAALAKEYSALDGIRRKVVRDIEMIVDEALQLFNPRPMVKARAKDFDSWYKKLIRIMQKNDDKKNRPPVTDLLGIRVVCPFIEDLDEVELQLRKTFDVVEIERKGSNHSFKEFGYESTHLLITIPESVVSNRGPCGVDVAEIQIRTILQDAWAEVEHELVYKAEFSPFDSPMKRKLAAVNASLSLADIIFQEIRDYQRQLNRELGKRRESFFKKIEENTDATILNERKMDTSTLKPFMTIEPSNGGASIDDLLLDALYAHNNDQFDHAIEIYSAILAMKPDERVRSVILKHRGMAYFAMSRYDEALDDFSGALALDPQCYKSAYYRAVVYSVRQEYGRALENFSHSLEINPYQYYVLFRRSQAYFHLGDYPQALADVESALALEPDSTSAKKLKKILLDKLKM